MNRTPVTDETLADPQLMADAYERHIKGTGLARSSKSTYAGEVARFCTWLATNEVAIREHDPVEVFTIGYARDYAARDYREWMLTKAKREPKGVDTALTSLSSLFGWLGLGRPDVKMVAGRKRTAPKALAVEERKRLLRAAERRGKRDLALVAVAIGSGLRAAELAALDTDDVWVTDRKGAVQVRHGKGGKPRTVPLAPVARDPLREWLNEHPGRQDRVAGPLWTKHGSAERLSYRTVRHTITAVGVEAEVDVSPHVLRHTYATMMLREAKADIVLVSELLGHASVETTRIYMAPTTEVAEAAVERLVIDY